MVCKVAGSCYITQGAHDSREGWNEVRGGREVREGGDICILLDDSHHCTAETNSTLESNYLPIKSKLKKKRTLLVQ